MTNEELMKLALAARKNAYAPYSGFQVGAALVGKSGKVYTGCNVENASYSLACCAERTALFKGISEGEKEFVAMAIAGGRGEDIAKNCPPCGACRQVLSEFCDKDFRLILGGAERLQAYTLEALFPLSFGKGDLQK